MMLKIKRYINAKLNSQNICTKIKIKINLTFFKKKNTQFIFCQIRQKFFYNGLCLVSDHLELGFQVF